MKLTIIPDDGMVIIDGSAHAVDLSDFPSDVHAVQWDGVSGHVERRMGAAEAIGSIDPFQVWIDRWSAAAVADPAYPPAATPETIREIALRSIDAQRDGALNSGFIHNNTLWHCDSTFQSQIQGFILAYTAGVLSSDAIVTIRAKNNTNHTMGRADVTALAGALMAHVQSIYAASWAAKDALP